MISLARVALLLHAEGAGYRGPDRRRLLPRLEEPAAPRVAAGALAAVVAIPLGGMAALLLVPRLAQASASVGAADVAVVAFAGAGLVLLVRWRLVGEAAVALQGIGVALAGLLLVPAVPQTGPLPDYVAALQITAVAAVLVLFGASLASPPVQAGLRPLALATWAFGLALALAVPLAFLITRERHEAAAMAAIRAAEALACVLVAGAVLVRGVRGRHLVFVAGAVALAAIAAACAAAASRWSCPPCSWPRAPPSFFCWLRWISGRPSVRSSSRTFAASGAGPPRRARSTACNGWRSGGATTCAAC